MLAACAGYHKYWSKTQLFVGLLQMLTAYVLVGWIWSWWWGWKFLYWSLNKPKDEQ